MQVQFPSGIFAFDFVWWVVGQGLGKNWTGLGTLNTEKCEDGLGNGCQLSGLRPRCSIALTAHQLPAPPCAIPYRRVLSPLCSPRPVVFSISMMPWLGTQNCISLKVWPGPSAMRSPLPSIYKSCDKDAYTEGKYIKSIWS